jgi:hypothetical protein
MRKDGRTWDKKEPARQKGYRRLYLRYKNDVTGAAQTRLHREVRLIQMPCCGQMLAYRGSFVWRFNCTVASTASMRSPPAAMA